MSENKEITLTVNDREVKGKEGDTILDICRANDIYIPTLCYLEGLSSVGACRLCVVEIEGERRINPACTYPARNGLVVRTHTEQLEKYRRQILELMFTERNHFCFFCAVSGDCELQKLAYEYQMDHTRYPYTCPSLPADTLNKYMVLDHNRCILCGRCVRICSEIVGNSTLSFGRRGWQTMVIADFNQPLGESSCISCGACMQACPTGALFSKLSAYKGRADECNKIRSICSLCGVGCEIDVSVKDNNIVRIDGADLTGLKGQLCAKGRFSQIYREAPRINAPLIVDRAGTVRASSWEEALDLIASAIKAYTGRYGADRIAGLISSLCPNETIESFANLMHNSVGTKFLDTLDGSVYRTLAQGIRSFSNNGKLLDIESPLESILEADCVIVAGVDPLETHPVAGCYVLRACARNQARLLVIDSQQNELGSRADIWLRPDKDDEESITDELSRLIAGNSKRTKKSRKAVSADTAESISNAGDSPLTTAADMIANAQSTVLIYGERIFNKKNPQFISSLLKLAKTANHGKPAIISLKPRGNSRGAWELGAAGTDRIAEASPRLLYIVLADDEYKADDWVMQAEQAEFLVVQASYASPITEAADVVLPSPIWAERSGEYITLDGKSGRSQRVLEPAPGIRDDIDIFNQLSEVIKKGRRSTIWRR